MEAIISSSIISGFAEKLSTSLKIDVAIVGAGTSGLVCGHILAKEGHKVSIFESQLAPGGGMWGGAMLNNEIVVQKDLAPSLDEFGIRYRESKGDVLCLDSVETAAAMIYKAVNAGAKVFNGITVEDVVYKKDQVAGVVINWSPVLSQGMHVDPLVVLSKVVLDASGHGAVLTAKVAQKAGIRLNTPSGGVVGEKPVWAEVGEAAVVENTKEVYPGLFVSGMAANSVFGSARMGPIFGGMIRSGRRAATAISMKIRE